MTITCVRTRDYGTDGWGQPCGNVNSTNPNVPCCAPGDQCLSDGLCKFTASRQLTSGYYVAGCTTSTGAGEGCPNSLCIDQNIGDVTFLTDSGRWACCGETSDGYPNCSDPTNEFFNAPPPSALATLFLMPTTGFAAISTSILSSSVISTSSTISTTLSTMSTASSASSPAASQGSGGGGLTTGAAAGIGVGAGLAVILGACLIGVIFLKRQRKSKRRMQHSVNKETGPPTLEMYRTRPLAEITAESQIPVEASTDFQYVEAPASPVRRV